ncbi:uncharacterized protein BO66DRAFT_78324 [Aspergillus aculeatinus CBS 121060]|uniref:Uncharacterized protein n=1 Tax=Aspergillus aculeatinus CBS 121060 TaxID=1448322 RepID=A0ACD1HB11_9EURO|nr:hypothetical protein BO66DRAFT_78324 [Aspergillus aculeatinus CBS 121060]RAH70696.1 hypothetical protein BO66DRAFT_78324 [Aspergillus aculeatinus CBS 121060]
MFLSRMESVREDPALFHVLCSMLGVPWEKHKLYTNTRTHTQLAERVFYFFVLMLCEEVRPSPLCLVYNNPCFKPVSLHLRRGEGFRPLGDGQWTMVWQWEIPAHSHTLSPSPDRGLGNVGNMSETDIQNTCIADWNGSPGARPDVGPIVPITVESGQGAHDHYDIFMSGFVHRKNASFL